MKIINNKFQKITVAIIFSWLIFFVLIPNLLVLTVSFLTRDGSDFYALPFTLDNYTNLFNPLYAQVVWNSIVYVWHRDDYLLTHWLSICFYGQQN